MIIAFALFASFLNPLKELKYVKKGSQALCIHVILLNLSDWVNCKELYFAFWGGLKKVFCLILFSTLFCLAQIVLMWCEDYGMRKKIGLERTLLPSLEVWILLGGQVQAFLRRLSYYSHQF